MKAKKFGDLEVWKKAHQLVLSVYRLTKDFPPEEKFGLVSQMRRAAVSIPANIAEGFKKRTLKDKINFYNVAQGSLEELRYYLILSKDLGFTKEQQACLDLAEEIGKMLYGLIKSMLLDGKQPFVFSPVYCLLFTVYLFQRLINKGRW